MSIEWPNRPDAGTRARAAALSRRTRLRERLDVVLVFGWLLTALALFLIGFLVFAFGKRQGWFDEPALQPVQDARILENLRGSPLVDAAMHHDGRLYVVQRKEEGDRIQRYQPETRTWSTLTPELPGLRQPFEVIRSGNGLPEAGTPLWGLTRDQGLAALHRGRWQTLAGDHAFSGVSSADLTCAALSADGRHALYATDGKGVGIFDRKHKTWSQPVLLRRARVTRAVWWKDRFWVADRSGLASVLLEPSDQGETTVERLNLDYAIQDLDISPDGLLYVLGQLNTGGMCLHSISGPDAKPKVLLSEGVIEPELELRDLHLAYQPRDTLWLGGDAGLFRYHTGTHTWAREFRKPVSRGVRAADGTLFFGVPGMIAAVNRNDELSRVKIPALQRIQDLSASPGTDDGGGGFALALSASNRLFEVRANGSEPVEWFPKRSTSLRPSSAHTVIARNGKIIFGTERGIVVHDVLKRSYTDYPRHLFGHREFARPGANLHISHPYVYSTYRNARTFHVHSIALDDLLSGSLNAMSALPSIKVDGDPRSILRWPGGHLLCVMRDGTLIRCSPGTMARVANPATTVDIDSAALVDVVQKGHFLHLAEKDRVHYYNMLTRAWGRSWRPPDGVEIAELGTGFDSVFIIDREGRFHLERENATYFGQPIPLEDREIADVFGNDKYLHLAADGGRIATYDFDERGLNKLVTLPVKGVPDIVGIPEDGRTYDAVSVCDGRLFLGRREIGAGDGEVRRAFVQGGSLWAIRSQGGAGGRGSLYQYNQLRPSNPMVFFDQPQAGFKVDEIAQVAPVADGVVVRTRSGELHEYRKNLRSWRRLPGPEATGLHFQLNPYANNQSELFVLYKDGDTSNLHRSSGSVSPGPKNRVTLRGVIDMVRVPSGDLYALQDDGTITHLPVAGGQIATVAPPGSTGIHLDGAPAQFSEIAFARRGRRQLAGVSERAGAPALWWFDQGWRQIDHPFRDATSLKLFGGQGTIAVTATLRSGQVVAARLENGRVVNQTPLYRATPPGRPGGSTLSGPIEKAWEADGRWLFLQGGKLHAFNPRTRKWDEAISGAPGPDFAYSALGDGAVFHRRTATGTTLHIRAGTSGGFRKIDLGADPLAYVDGKLLRIKNGQVEASNSPSSAGFPRFAPNPAPRPAGSFKVDGAGRLTAGGRVLAPRGEFVLITGRDTELLNAGWLKWRDGRFQLNTPDGPVQMAGRDLVSGGEILPGQVLDLLAHEDNLTSVLTPTGVFVHRKRGLPLDDSRILFQALRGQNLRFEHGQILGAEGPSGQAMRLRFNGAKWVPSTSAELEVTPNIVIRTRSGGASLESVNGASLRRGDATQSRQALRVVGDKVWVVTREGSHPLKQPGRLQRSTPPTSTPAAFRDNQWEWSFTPAGKAVVNILNPPYALRAGPVALPFDQLIDAAVYKGRVVLLTSAGLELVNKANHLGGPRSFVPVPKGTTRIEVRSGELGVRSRAGWHRYEESGGFRPPVVPTGRTLFENDRLTFRRLPSGRIEKSIALDLPRNKGKDKRQAFPFALEAGFFPFDRANAIREHRGHVYLATDAGLEIYYDANFYRTQGSAVWSRRALRQSDAKRIWHLANPRDPISPVHTLSPSVVPGRGAKGPVLMRAVSEDGTFKMTGADFAEGSPDAPERRVEYRVRNPFWEWRRSGGRVSGNYIGASRKETLPVTFLRHPKTGKRSLFPHDQIIDAGVFDNTTHLLWGEGWLTRIPGGNTALNLADVTNEDLRSRRPKAFISLAEPARADRSSRFDLYLDTASGRLLKAGPKRFGEVDLDTQDLVREAKRLDLVYQDKRLRLHPPRNGRPSRFEMLASTGWTDLPWHPDGVLAIDRFDAVAATEQGCWAVTRSGLLHLDRPSPGDVLQPFSGRLRPLPDVDRKPGEKPLPFTDLDVRDGQLYLRQGYQTNRVWRTATRAGAADSVLHRVAEDPFSGTTWVDREAWTWRQVGGHSGLRGWLRATWHGEDLNLVGGRFPFDTVNSIAFFRGDLIEFGTDHGGWLQARENSNGLGPMTRPDVPGVDSLDVRGVRVVPAPDGGRELGLMRENDVLRLSADNVLRETKDAPELQFDDGFWTAVQGSDGKLSMVTERGEPVVREMVDGRFLDHLISGLPVTTRRDGQKRTLLATRGGLLVLDDELRPVEMALPPGDEKLARPLLVDDDGQPRFLVATNAIPLDPEGGDLSVPFLGGIPVLAERAPMDLLRVRSRTPQGLRTSLIRLGAERPVAFDHLVPLSASDQVRAGEDGAVLGVAFRRPLDSARTRPKPLPPKGKPITWCQVLFARPGEDSGIAYELQVPFDGLEKARSHRVRRSILTDDHLYVLTDRDLWVVDLQQAKDKALSR